MESGSMPPLAQNRLHFAFHHVVNRSISGTPGTVGVGIGGSSPTHERTLLPSWECQLLCFGFQECVLLICGSPDQCTCPKSPWLGDTTTLGKDSCTVSPACWYSHGVVLKDHLRGVLKQTSEAEEGIIDCQQFQKVYVLSTNIWYTFLQAQRFSLLLLAYCLNESEIPLIQWRSGSRVPGPVVPLSVFWLLGGCSNIHIPRGLNIYLSPVGQHP